MQTRRERASNNGKVREPVNALRADLIALSRDMGELAGGLGGAAADRFNSAVDGAIEGANRTARTAAARVQDWSADGMGAARKAMRERPVALMAAFMTLGALTSALLMRRSRSDNTPSRTRRRRRMH
jgi:hypothetical protein